MLRLFQKVLHNKIFWYLTTRYLTFAMQLISSIYVAVKLGVYYWGIWSFILLLVNIGYQLNWGIGPSITILMVQHKNEEQLCRKYIYNAFILVLFGMLPAILFTFYERLFGIPFFEKYHLGSMVYGVLLVMCLYHLNILLMNICRARNHVFSIAFNQSVFPAACFILMFFSEEKTLMNLLLGGYVLAMLISFVVYMRYGYILFSEKIDLSLCRSIFQKGFFLFLYNACFVLIVLTTKTLISYYYSVESFGLFSFAFNLASAALLLVDNVTFIAQARMIDLLQGDDPATNLKRIELMRRCYLVCVTGIIYFAIPAFYLLIHFVPKYKDAFTSFTLIVLALDLYPICYGYNSYLMAHNKEKVMALLAGLALLLNLLITWILASCFHVPMEYCLIGIMIAYLLYAFAVNLFAEKIISSTWQWKNAMHYIPLYVFIPFVLAFSLQLIGSIQILWIPLVVFLIFGFQSIVVFLKDMIQFINRPDVMDIKQDPAG